jgi:hypothetical protein
MNALRQVSGYLVLIPAYGRRYKDKDSMLADWQNGKDFKIVGGPYCSIRDLESMKNDASTIWLNDGSDFLNVRIA